MRSAMELESGGESAFVSECRSHAPARSFAGQRRHIKPGSAPLVFHLPSDSLQLLEKEELYLGAPGFMWRNQKQQPALIYRRCFPASITSSNRKQMSSSESEVAGICPSHSQGNTSDIIFI
ncbi:hypothetical protein CRENBAI_019371 [Crenichthys baileyi]|uniref:Uncharacterized protein n=1 Tax=Crenichthys baileyi TaxID=28760 RepID=A0AAV9RA51_9TELE